MAEPTAGQRFESGANKIATWCSNGITLGTALGLTVIGVVSGVLDEIQDFPLISQILFWVGLCLLVLALVSGIYLAVQRRRALRLMGPSAGGSEVPIGGGGISQTFMSFQEGGSAVGNVFTNPTQRLDFGTRPPMGSVAPPDGTIDMLRLQRQLFDLSQKVRVFLRENSPPEYPIPQQGQQQDPRVEYAIHGEEMRAWADRVTADYNQMFDDKVIAAVQKASTAGFYESDFAVFIQHPDGQHLQDVARGLGVLSERIADYLDQLHQDPLGEPDPPAERS